jgi:hypothetical protein
MDLFRNQTIQKGEKRRGVKMKITLEKPKNFSIFCKNCGSYEIIAYLTIDDEIVLNCEKCDIEEEI